jgi:chemotaxis protein MotB
MIDKRGLYICKIFGPKKRTKNNKYLLFMNFKKIQQMKSIKLLSYFIVSTIFFACVPLNQYKDLEESNQQLSDRINDLSSENELLAGNNNELKELADRLKTQVTELTADTLQKGRKVRACESDLQKIRAEYDDLLAQLRSQTGAGDSEELLDYLQTLQEDLQEREDALIASERDLRARENELQEAMNNLKSAQEELEMAQLELEAQNRRLIELEQALARKDSASNALRKAISDALMGFDQSQLQVHIKNGKVYVSMEEKLLFGSGSYQLSNEGASAIRQVADVLADQNDINIMIEGHTDPVPYRSGVLLDNWDLSVKRATSVTRILLENSAIDPSRVIAAGRGEHVPLTTNDTAEGKRKNRRTEIILTPRLDQVLDILETH